MKWLAVMMALVPTLACRPCAAQCHLEPFEGSALGGRTVWISLFPTAAPSPGVYGVPMARSGCHGSARLRQCELPCYANCDGSLTPPVLNVLDFNRFTAGDAYSSCDGSTAAPVLNVFDFNCFLNRFTAGCP